MARWPGALALELEAALSGASVVSLSVAVGSEQQLRDGAQPALAAVLTSNHGEQMLLEDGKGTEISFDGGEASVTTPAMLNRVVVLRNWAVLKKEKRSLGKSKKRSRNDLDKDSPKLPAGSFVTAQHIEIWPTSHGFPVNPPRAPELASVQGPIVHNP